LEQTTGQGPPHLVLNGKVVVADRKEKAISTKARQIDRWQLRRGTRVRRAEVILS
jgi:hypothetical protein